MALQLIKIADYTVQSPQATVTFSSIPQGYTDLKLVISGRTTYAGVNSSVYLYPNGVNTSTSSRVLYATSAAAGSGTYSYIIGRDISGNNSTANTFGSTEFYIPNYTSSNYKSFSCDSVGENNALTGDILMGLNAGLWSNTSAITSLVVYTDGSFNTNSTFTLYGVL
jgi:hypothetical protein